MSNISALHQSLVERLKQQGLIRTPRVETAFRAVPRHLFLPDVPLKKVYKDEAIVTKRLDGQAVSSSSQPAVMAIMLEQLDLQPGDRVLEIGAGTGYNAALMAHIVGETGQVIAIDIDEDIVEDARQHLAKAGFEQVKVVCTDGGFGYPSAAPYDRIILTVAAWDIAIAWQEQLKPQGRLVLPLTLKDNVQITVAFESADSYLVSISTSNCGFMKLRGAFAEPQEAEDTISIHLNKLLMQVENILLLPLPIQLQLKLYNLIKFRRSSLKGLRIRVYPQDTDYIKTADEFVIVKRWTRLVLDWQ
ncbi:methyltransferase domain-containing protein [Nostoc sp. CHAB 5715]|uniref:methyltransferase domain-containing protein n=1 Tax=Nostoc sp. CHAB 5715 TaxID=2780400 RepID=UPI001E329230|nr:methyltransferase domain-containing protein [Nostoc sp. CHAB 5715]MCC5622960.1 methyltransferase domain-containing protein [Nostoc sp. CHAB 5715]